VAPTTMGDELANKVAPHLDALLEIAENDVDDASGRRTLHLAGPPEFITLRVLPALSPIVAEGSDLRTAFVGDEEALIGLAAGHHDLAIGTVRPRDRLLAATPLWDEEHILVAAPPWREHIGGPDAVRRVGPRLLDDLPVIAWREERPLLTHYWAAVFDTKPPHVPAIVVPDLRAVLQCVLAGAGMSVLPRYLVGDHVASGRLAALLEPAVPPLRTYFLSVRAGTLSLPHLARAHDQLLRAASAW
jgi:DNA-binding transcriptional LysR family regulator